MAFLLPHEMIGSMVKEDSKDQWVSIGEDQAGFKAELGKWGHRMGIDTSSDPWGIISLWGDAGPTVKEESLYLLSWSLLSGVIRQRFWAVAFNKSRICACGCRGRHTFDRIFAVMAWSIRALIAGFYPSHDHQGVAFERGSCRGEWAQARKQLPIRGVCLAKYGDWAWFRESLGLMGLERRGTQG